MTLEQLSGEALRVTGNALGFVIRSQAHPDRKFRVCYKFASGKYGITRLDNGKDFLVDGGEDRYDFVIPIGRIREVKAEKAELLEQMETIQARLGELDGVMDGLTNVAAG